MVIGGLSGLAVGIVLGGRKFMSRAYEAYLYYLGPCPKIIFFPIMIMWFGVGPGSKVAMGAISCFFPVALNVAGGMREIDKVLIRVGRSFRANTWQMVTKIYLPAMRHPVINGVRLGLGVALIGTLLAETKLSNRGIGFLVIQAYSIFNMPLMYALLIILFVIAIGANELIGRRRRARQHQAVLNRRSIVRRGVPWSAVASAAQGRAARSSLPSHRDPYYAGKWQKPKSDRYVDTINPGTGESLGKVVDGSVADAEAAIAAAKAAFREWRRVPPLERAKMLREIADVLRKNGDELAMIDAADCGNPYAEMVRDAQCRRGAARFLCRPRHRDEGRLDPDGAGRREFLGARAVRRGRPHHSVQPSLHVRRRQVGGAARRRQYHRGEAAGAGAAVVAAARRTDRRHPAAGRVEPGARRQGSRRRCWPAIRTSRRSR